MIQPSSPRRFLAPFVPAYRLALWLRERRLGTSLEPIQQLKYPVVSIGNLSTGGSGKTPLCIALAKALAARGYHADVLSRGYGRRDKAPALVSPAGTAGKFGDEPLLIAREAAVPVYVAAQRIAAGQLAEADAAALAVVTGRPIPLIHLLDDGFQHRQLRRDVDILLIDRNDLGDTLLPAGNLREPLAAARRASILALPADQPELEPPLRTLGFSGPFWRVHRRMRVPASAGPVVAFCGIARPEQFFIGLESYGLKPATTIAFRDHHPYTPRDVERLLAAARSIAATALVTTEKDLVRLGDLAGALAGTLPVVAAGLQTEIEDADHAIDDLLARLKLDPTQPAL